MNIVILEDEAIITIFLQSTLEDVGHNVIGVFESAQPFLEFLKTNTKVDLIFADININGSMDGIETIKEYKQANPDILVVYVSSYKDSLTMKRAKDTRPNAYLVKPFIESDIHAVLMVIESIYENMNKANEIKIKNYLYKKDLKEIYDDSKLIQLSFNERVCLDTLIVNMGSTTSLEELIVKIWDGEKNRTQSLRELIFRLRKKLPNLEIKSVSKTGYILE